MATKLNETSKGILGEASEKIGSFQESTGGGTPLKKGQKLKDHPEAKRVMQPRDEDGQFTYNSVNGKGLKYGPSRGTTVPPFLRGVKLTFCQPGTKLKLDGPDGIKVRIMTIDMSVEELVNACKYYIESEEGFAGLGKGSSILKKGRKSKEEKEAKAGQAGYVDPKTLRQGTQDEMKNAANEYANKNSAQKVNPFVDEAPFVHPNNQKGYQVQDDTLNPDGTTSKNTSARYNTWYQKNSQQAAQQKAQAAQAAQAAQQAQQQKQAQQQPQQNQQPVTPSGAPAQPQKPAAPTKQSIQGGLANLFGKNTNSPAPTNNNQNNNKFGGLNQSTFSNLFKK